MKQVRVIYLKNDNLGRPTYKTEKGTILKDLFSLCPPNKDEVIVKLDYNLKLLQHNLHTCSVDGEPSCPVSKDIEFFLSVVL